VQQGLRGKKRGGGHHEYNRQLWREGTVFGTQMRRSQKSAKTESLGSSEKGRRGKVDHGGGYLGDELTKPLSTIVGRGNSGTTRYTETNAKSQ